MKTEIIVVIGLYLIFTLFIGLIAHKKSHRTSEDYFVASRSLNWIHLGLTMFATWMSTFAFLGSPGFYYKKGVSWFLPHGFLVIGSPLLLWFIGRKLWLLGREGNYITPAELLSDFYNSTALRYIFGLISLLALVPYCLIQLIGIGKVIDAATDSQIPYSSGVIMAVLGITFYTIWGGVRAIIWTDVVQAMLFGGVMLLGAGIAIYASGGVFTGISKSVDMNPEIFVFDSSNIGSPLTLLIIWTFGYILMPHMWQRAYMAKSANSLSKSIVLSSVLALIFIVLPSLLIGMLGAGFMPGVADSDKFVPMMYAKYFNIATPLLVLATFAAGMSTIDSQLLSASSVLVRDIVQPIKGIALNAELEKKLGKVFVFILIVMLTLMALSPAGQKSIILLASKGTGIALLLLVPLLGPLCWSQATKNSVLWSTYVGFTLLLVLEYKLLTISIPWGFGPPVIAALVQFAIFSVLNLLPQKEA